MRFPGNENVSDPQIPIAVVNELLNSKQQEKLTKAHNDRVAEKRAKQGGQ